jgi:hypothetical protein
MFKKFLFPISKLKQRSPAIIATFTLAGLLAHGGSASALTAAEPDAHHYDVAAAEPREALPFNGVKADGELRTRIAKNFERLHAERYQIDHLFTKSHDPKWPGDMEGRATLGLVLDAQALGIDEPGIDGLFSEYPKHYNNDGYIGPTIQGYDLIREGPLLLAARLPEQPENQKASPVPLPLGGELKSGQPGKPTMGATPLMPVYHLLDPAYDQTKGSWRQMLFPKN